MYETSLFALFLSPPQECHSPTLFPDGPEKAIDFIAFVLYFTLTIKLGEPHG